MDESKQGIFGKARSRIAVITDQLNDGLYEPFNLQLSAAVRNSSAKFPQLQPDLVHLTASLGDEASLKDLAAEFDRPPGFKTAVFIVGNIRPNATQEEAAAYAKSVIHPALKAWSMSERRPVILFVSDNPAQTRAAIDSSPIWQTLSEQLNQPVDMLKEAVAVNTNYLISHGGKVAWGEVRQRLEKTPVFSKSTTHVIPIVPSASVTQPTISEHQAREPSFDLGA